MKSYNIAKNCNAIRTMLKMSQTDFAKEIGVSFSTINIIENNILNLLESTIEKIYSLESSKAEMAIKEHRHQGRYIEDILNE